MITFSKTNKITEKSSGAYIFANILMFDLR